MYPADWQRAVFQCDSGMLMYGDEVSWFRELPQLAVIVASGVAWPQVPERVPVHWNIHDQVDRYGGRFEQ